MYGWRLSGLLGGGNVELNVVRPRLPHTVSKAKKLRVKITLLS